MVVYKLVFYVNIDGLCVYTNFQCCHSLGCVTYTNSSLWPEGIFQCETESKGLTNFLVYLSTGIYNSAKFKVLICELRVLRVSYAYASRKQYISK